MRTLSLSTMWAQQARFQSAVEFGHTALELGYSAIEVSHVTGEAGMQALAESDIPVSSVHAPAPHMIDSRGRPNSHLNLASLDDEEREDAVAATINSIDWAHRLGASLVVVHLGAVVGEFVESEHLLRRLVGEGNRSAQFEELRREVISERARLAPRHLDAAAQSLERLVSHSSQKAVGLGLECRSHYHEIPLMEETLRLLEDYPPELAGYWHDIGHAVVMEHLGLAEAEPWLNALGRRTVGTHLHDVIGTRDHLAPGKGQIEWQLIEPDMPESALRVFEIDQKESERDVAAAIPYLVRMGIV